MVEFIAPFRLPENLGPLVEKMWAEEKRLHRQKLSNGRMHSLVERTPQRLVLQTIEYRHMLALRRRPELAQAGLPIRPLAVTGILMCADGLVLGRRSSLVIADAQVWEPVPAGALTLPDPVAQLLEELTEEVGLQPHRVTPPEPCGLVEDIASGITDIVFRFRTAASSAEILEAHQTYATSEYAGLVFINPAALSGFLEANRSDLLPTLRPMLQLAGYLSGTR